MALLASTLLHLLGIWLAHVLIPPQVKDAFFTARIPSYMPVLPARHRPRPAVAVPHELLERLRSEVKPPAPDTGLEEEAVVPPEPVTPELEEVRAEVGEKPPWEAEVDTMLEVTLGSPMQVTELPLARDPVLMDAEARRNTVVLTDPVSGKLRWAHLHLPSYKNYPVDLPPCQWHGGRVVAEIHEKVKRGVLLPDETPVNSTIHYYRIGDACWRPRASDPIHRFSRYPGRHLLHSSEMKEYAVLFLSYIDVESTEALVSYLAEGGFAFLADRGQLALLEREIGAQFGDRLQGVMVELGHPLFHSFHDITRYVAGGPRCPGIGPLPALELDGRLVALVPPRFTVDAPCIANEFYVNALAFALVQPSRMGGRYLARRGKQDTSRSTRHP